MSIGSRKIAEASHPQHLLNSKGDGDVSENSTREDEEKVGGKYLGIDFGQAEVGLALADTETRMAFAYKKIKNNRDLLKILSAEINAKNVTAVVIGVPSYFAQKKEDYAGVKLGRRLKEELDIRVEYCEEMFTTKMAQANLVAKGVKGVKRYDDQESARIILQEWLDNQAKP